MNNLSELLLEAKRRAKLTGRPLSRQELAGISESASIGAGDRVALFERLRQEKENQLRMRKSAKDAMALNKNNQAMDSVGDALNTAEALDQMTGGKIGIKTPMSLAKEVAGKGVDFAIDKTGMRPTVDALSRKVGSLTGNVIGNSTAGLTLAGMNAIPGVTLGTPMTMAPAVAAAKGALMSQIAPNSASLFSTAGSAGTGATGGGLSGMIGSIATPVGYVAAADAVRNMFGGDLERPYKEAGWSQKIARTPVAANVPGVMGLPSAAAETELADKVLGKSNPISKINNQLGALEDKVVGKNLDKIFKGVGSLVKKIFCFCAGTQVEMEDGSIKNVEDVKIGDMMLEGGRVIGTGQVENDDIWSYNGVKLAGTHAVMEDGTWKRVSDSRYGKPLDQESPVVVYPICNENHVVISNGVVFSDYMETDHGTNVNDSFRLEYMNNQNEWNEYLSQKYPMKRAA